MDEEAKQILKNQVEHSIRETSKLKTLTGFFRPATCKKCEDTGYVLIKDKLGTERAVRCECMIPKMLAAVIPPEFQRASLADFSERVSNVIREWLASPGLGLLIDGDVGVGKTHLMFAILKAWMAVDPRNSERGSFFVFTSKDFYQQLRSVQTLGSSSESVTAERALMQDFGAVPMLMVDDIASGLLSDFERRELQEILGRRRGEISTGWPKPTVLTSNWNAQQIAEKLDDRIGSRLKGLKNLRLMGKDARR